MPEINSTLQNKIQTFLPKIIHRIWMSWDPKKPNMSETYQENDVILKQLHHEWQFNEWDDKKTLNFVNNIYPELLETYVTYDEPIKRHDVSRYLILKHFGGVFIQHSMRFQKNIEPLIQNYQLVFSKKTDIPGRENELNNAFIASVPNHPFWDHLIVNLKAEAHKPVMNATGPHLVTNLLTQYQQINHDESIKILDRKFLFPFYISNKQNHSIEENCFKNPNNCFKLFPESYAFSPWDSSWTKSNVNFTKIDLSQIDLANNTAKVFVMSLKNSGEEWKDKSEVRWTKISQALDKTGLEYEMFKAVNGYNIEITDPLTKQTFHGSDIKKYNLILPKNQFFKIKCDNGVNDPVVIYNRGESVKLMAGNLGVWCTKTLIRNEIIKQQYKYAVIFEDDFAPKTENFLEEFHKFVNDLPNNWDIAYLHCFITGQKFFHNITSAVQVPDYQAKLSPLWHGDWAHLVSYSGAIKLIFGDHRYYFASDEFSRSFAKGMVKKPFVDQFNAYFATHNFSKYSPITFTGHNGDSISTKMGCRENHPSDQADCINKNITLNDVVNLMGLTGEEITT